MPREQLRRPKRHAQLPGHGVHADAGEQQAQRHRNDRLVLVLAAEADKGAEGQEIDGEELRRAEFQRKRGDQRRQEGDQQHRDERADEGRGERRGQRLRRPALLRHRIAVEGGRHRPGLAGNVEQDRGDGAAEQRAPIDAGQHHDRRGRVHREGQRQQDRHAVGAAEPGQNADENAEHQPDHHQRKRLPGEQNGKAVQEQAEGFHHESSCRHCEEQRDEAIQTDSAEMVWIASWSLSWAALRADPFARNDGERHIGSSVTEGRFERPFRHDDVEHDIEGDEHDRA